MNNKIIELLTSGNAEGIKSILNSIDKDRLIEVALPILKQHLFNPRVMQELYDAGLTQIEMIGDQPQYLPLKRNYENFAVDCYNLWLMLDKLEQTIKEQPGNEGYNRKPDSASN